MFGFTQTGGLHIDHVTYVAREENERGFIERWRMLGFREHVRLTTSRFPATHIALVGGQLPGAPWAAMTGLSVSPDPASPVNEFTRRYGEGLQHVAYAISPDMDFEVLGRDLERSGWQLMTRVLTYQDPAGARLRQLFAAPLQPFGPFIEFIQRHPGPGGLPFDGFDTTNIDDLYEAYADYSRWLERSPAKTPRARCPRETNPSLWDPEHETLPPEGMRALQEQRLKACVRRAYERVPFYRRRLDEAGVRPEDIRTLEDLSGLPLTTKDDLRNESPFGLLAVERERLVRVHASSGSTGAPTVVAYTRKDLELWADLCARALASTGVRPGSTLHIAYGYGLFTGGLGFQAGAERLGALGVPAGPGNAVRQLQLIQRLRADVLLATPSYALSLLEEAERAGVEGARLGLKVGVFGGEAWSEALRQRLETGWGLRAFDTYGLSEVLGPGVAHECEARGGLHLYEDHFLPEVIDPATGRVLPEGELGELVLTAVTKEAMPVLRYRTRDLTRLTRGQCACGRELVRMERVAGRVDDLLQVGARTVLPSAIEEVLLRLDSVGPQYQIVRAHQGPPVVQVERAGPDTARGEREMAQMLEHALGISLAVRLVPPGTLPRSEGKAQRLVRAG